MSELKSIPHLQGLNHRTELVLITQIIQQYNR